MLSSWGQICWTDIAALVPLRYKIASATDHGITNGAHSKALYNIAGGKLPISQSWEAALCICSLIKRETVFHKIWSCGLKLSLSVPCNSQVWLYISGQLSLTVFQKLTKPVKWAMLWRQQTILQFTRHPEFAFDFGVSLPGVGGGGEGDVGGGCESHYRNRRFPNMKTTNRQNKQLLISAPSHLPAGQLPSRSGRGLWSKSNFNFLPEKLELARSETVHTAPLKETFTLAWVWGMEPSFSLRAARAWRTKQAIGARGVISFQLALSHRGRAKRQRGKCILTPHHGGSVPPTGECCFGPWNPGKPKTPGVVGGGQHLPGRRQYRECGLEVKMGLNKGCEHFLIVYVISRTQAEFT